jgi:hypothetical protein
LLLLEIGNEVHCTPRIFHRNAAAESRESEEQRIGPWDFYMATAIMNDSTGYIFSLLLEKNVKSTAIAVPKLALFHMAHPNQRRSSASAPSKVSWLLFNANF